jgi:hypothetical protein
MGVRPVIQGYPYCVASGSLGKKRPKIVTQVRTTPISDSRSHCNTLTMGSRATLLTVTGFFVAVSVA